MTQFLLNNHLVAPEQVWRGDGGLTAHFPQEFSSWLVSEAFDGAGHLTAVHHDKAPRAYEIVELKLGGRHLEVTLRRRAGRVTLH